MKSISLFASVVVVWIVPAAARAEAPSAAVTLGPSSPLALALDALLPVASDLDAGVSRAEAVVLGSSRELVTCTTSLAEGGAPRRFQGCRVSSVGAGAAPSAPELTFEELASYAASANLPGGAFQLSSEEPLALALAPLLPVVASSDGKIITEAVVAGRQPTLVSCTTDSFFTASGEARPRLRGCTVGAAGASGAATLSLTDIAARAAAQRE